MADVKFKIRCGRRDVITECNKDESWDIGAAVACLLTNVSFQPL